MPKNYRALTKLRKQQFERAEQALASANSQRQHLEAEKERLRSDARELEIPGSGFGRELGLVVNQRSAIKSAIEALDYRIQAAAELCTRRQEELMAAHVAYEQAKSIEAQIMQKRLAKTKRLEQGSLDEIASQRFWRDAHTEDESF
ncbi:flagellar FliJ family protein [Hydrogenimonas sp.]